MDVQGNKQGRGVGRKRPLEEGHAKHVRRENIRARNQYGGDDEEINALTKPRDLARSLLEIRR